MKNKTFGVSNKEYKKRYIRMMGDLYGKYGTSTLNLIEGISKTKETEEKGVIAWLIKWILKP